MRHGYVWVIDYTWRHKQNKLFIVVKQWRKIDWSSLTALRRLCRTPNNKINTIRWPDNKREKRKKKKGKLHLQIRNRRRREKRLVYERHFSSVYDHLYFMWYSDTIGIMMRICQTRSHLSNEILCNLFCSFLPFCVI